METKISASILNADLLHIEDAIRRVENAGADMLHFDVMDGLFVPNISFGLPVLKAISGSTELFRDVHLMIQHPLHYIDSFYQAGANMITFHIESHSDPFRTIRTIHDLGIKAGIALKPRTPARAVLPFLDVVDNILVMTVEPGFGGQDYIPEMTGKIREVRRMLENRPVSLQVDGGIHAGTVQTAREAGADLLVAGSYLFQAADMAAAVRSLRPEGAVS